MRQLQPDNGWRQENGFAFVDHFPAGYLMQRQEAKEPDRSVKACDCRLPTLPSM